MTKQFGKKMDDENESMNVWKQNITSQHSKKIIWHATVAVALTLKKLPHCYSNKILCVYNLSLM